MRPFSRNIPEYVPKKQKIAQTIISFLAISVFITLLFIWIYNQPFIAAGFVVLFILYTIHWNLDQNKRLTQIAALRKGESICEFARSFDRKKVDPWIIRVVWQELQDYLERKNYGEFPIRKSDQLEKLYKIDLEDLEYDLEIFAQRIGRSLKNTINNPYYSKVTTVGDLVLFLNHQPLIITS